MILERVKSALYYIKKNNSKSNDIVLIEFFWIFYNFWNSMIKIADLVPAILTLKFCKIIVCMIGREISLLL